MMKYLLAATAAIVMVASAAAQTMDDNASVDTNTNENWLECSVTRADRDADPVYKVMVSIEDDSFARVIHVTQSGKVYNRASQYDVSINSHSKQGANLWVGRHIKKNNLFMSGTLGVINGKLYYKEWRPSSSNVLQTLVMESVRITTTPAGPPTRHVPKSITCASHSCVRLNWRVRASVG